LQHLLPTQIANNIATTKNQKINCKYLILLKWKGVKLDLVSNSGELGRTRGDYAKLANRPDSKTVMAQLKDWFDDYNSYHPHSALGYLPPTLFREKRSVT
jgi:transposase InsO family protein